jgi:hypothetical protein
MRKANRSKPNLCSLFCWLATMATLLLIGGLLVPTAASALDHLKFSESCRSDHFKPYMTSWAYGSTTPAIPHEKFPKPDGGECVFSPGASFSFVANPSPFHYRCYAFRPVIAAGESLKIMTTWLSETFRSECEHFDVPAKIAYSINDGPLREVTIDPPNEYGRRNNYSHLDSIQTSTEDEGKLKFLIRKKIPSAPELSYEIPISRIGATLTFIGNRPPVLEGKITVGKILRVRWKPDACVVVNPQGSDRDISAKVEFHEAGGFRDLYHVARGLYTGPTVILQIMDFVVPERNGRKTISLSSLDFACNGGYLNTEFKFE